MGEIAYCDRHYGGWTFGLAGCSHAGAGCGRCWAESFCARFAKTWGWPDGMIENGRWTGKVHADYRRLKQGFKKLPGPRSKIKLVFPWDTCDLFHERVPDLYIAEAFRLMSEHPWLTFMILTKRPLNALQWLGWWQLGAQSWPPNVWIGVSVSTQDDAGRLIPDLLRLPAPVRIVSYEPALGSVDLPLRMDLEGRDVTATPGLWSEEDERIGWVIVGAESHPGGRAGRSMKLVWAKSVVEQCAAAGVPCWVKQLPILGPDGARILSDPNHSKWPDWAVQQRPEVTR